MMTLAEFETRLRTLGVQHIKVFESPGLKTWNAHATLSDGSSIVAFGEESPSKAMLRVLERAEGERKACSLK